MKFLPKYSTKLQVFLCGGRWERRIGLGSGWMNDAFIDQSRTSIRKRKQRGTLTTGTGWQDNGLGAEVMKWYQKQRDRFWNAQWMVKLFYHILMSLYGKEMKMYIFQLNNNSDIGIPYARALSIFAMLWLNCNPAGIVISEFQGPESVCLEASSFCFPELGWGLMPEEVCNSFSAKTYRLDQAVFKNCLINIINCNINTIKATHWLLKSWNPKTDTYKNFNLKVIIKIPWFPVL